MKKDFEPVEARVNAKINIGLQIVRKRPDGYHDLQMKGGDTFSPAYANL